MELRVFRDGTPPTSGTPSPAIPRAQGIARYTPNSNSSSEDKHVVEQARLAGPQIAPAYFKFTLQSYSAVSVILLASQPAR